ncbi:MAG: ATP-binding cassette domain-containing protein [bacterium]
MTFLSVHNLSMSVGKKALLHNISFSAPLGKVTVILGPNGAGKTTLLKTIMGLYKPPIAQESLNINSITLDKQLINNWPVHKKTCAGLIYLPQHPSIFQQMSVQDNLKLVYEYHPTWENKPLSEFEKQCTEWLEKVHLTVPTTQKAGTLSGGQKRKLEVIRSLLMQPKMIMFDEPFAGVDPKSIYELKKIFSDMALTDGIGIIISDHHVDQLLSIADNVYVIINGKVVTSGSIQDILKDKATKERYLGSQFFQEMSDRFLK